MILKVNVYSTDSLLSLNLNILNCQNKLIQIKFQLFPIKIIHIYIY